MTTQFQIGPRYVSFFFSKRFVCALLPLLTSVSPAQLAAQTQQQTSKDTATPQIAAELKALQAKTKANPSFRVKFEQKVFSALRKKTTTSSGELAFSQPRKFRWEVNAPSREIYTNNGEWFWKYVESTKHALRMTANSSDLDFLDVVFQLDKLSGKYILEKTTSIPGNDQQSSINCPANNTCVMLEPLQKSAQKRIALAIDQSTGFVSLVKIEFRNGNRTHIEFSAFTPEKIAAQVFEFTPPPGTAIDKR